MTVSMRVMSAGNGYQYLLRSVVAGDGNRQAMLDPLTRYYTEEGTPPGRWMGSGLHALRRRSDQPGTEVTEAQLALLHRHGPRPGHGRAARARVSRVLTPVGERIAARIAELEPET